MEIELEEVAVIKLFDGSLSCRYNDLEFFILPEKKNCDNNALEMAFEALLAKVEESVNKEINGIGIDQSW